MTELWRYWKSGVFGGALVAVVVLVVKPSVFHSLWLFVAGRSTVSARVDQYGLAARRRLQPHFERTSLVYPPKRVLLVGLKEERALELYASSDEGWVLVRRYPVLAASGRLGPKLREGDRQVPEGFYEIESLNPNSMFHLSLRLNYPNQEDLRWAHENGRSDPGGDIMIHGENVSIGCLAMGNPAVEELFVLAHDVGLSNIEVIVSPLDFRTGALPSGFRAEESWIPGLHSRLNAALKKLQPSRPSKHFD